MAGGRAWNRWAVGLWSIHFLVTAAALVAFIGSLYRSPVPPWVLLGPAFTGTVGMTVTIPAIWRGMLSYWAEQLSAVGSLLTILWYLAIATESRGWLILVVVGAVALVVALARSVVRRRKEDGA